MASVGDIFVLVVDDNRQIRYLVRNLLRAAGVTRVAEAEDGEEALVALRRFPIDLVLLDWKMAPMSGLEFTQIVRRGPDSPNPYVPILMVTAHTEASRVAAARDAGVSGFLRKPISARALFDRVQSALLDPRLFVKTESFFGPDRRHGLAHGYKGPFRRGDDRERGDTLDVDDLRHCA